MEDFEKLGQFYLGRSLDGGLLLYDSRDLTTHAVCVGMTGSGKTGLCIGLLEEAAIDGIPALVIDPKGDLTNLMLTFPELRPEDFAPWVNREAGEDPAAQAELWRKGLEKWGQSGERIRKLKESAEFAVYTPGSAAGIPVSIVHSFAAPGAAEREDREALRERVSGAATSLLGLLGIAADPVKSREHILISNILMDAWLEGRDLDIGAIIQAIQSPPMKRVGVLDLESFYPARERFELAMMLNNLLASPGFEAWLEGAPLDVDRFLYAASGKPRIAIFSIAHLSDAERMFFVSLLLNQTVSWMRRQSGSTSLRAIVYMDEIFGYFPPVSNPPSKLPLLTLLKQARAFGVGVVLATQNPVDLDYKGLANCGTWFIGRLQTERDKARVLDGLEGAATAAGAGFDRAALDRTLSGLGKRIFLMNNVHERAPALFETRWTLSYLRGPMTRDQIRELAQSRAAAPSRPAPLSTPPAGAAAASARPVLPANVPQFFLPVRGGAEGVVYHPVLYGAAQVRFSDAKTKVDYTRSVAFFVPIEDTAAPVDWAKAEEVDVAPEDLEAEPAEGAGFAELPPAAANAKSYPVWSKEFANWLFANQTLELLSCQELEAVAEAGESERDFRVRLQQAARERRDAEQEKLRARYSPKMAALEDRIRRAEQAAQREREQAQSAKLQTAVSIGTGLLGAFLGRKALSATNLERAATAARTLGRAQKESSDVQRAIENVEALRQQLAVLREEFDRELAALEGKLDVFALQFGSTVLRPKRGNISVRLAALVWAPYRGAAPAW